MIKNRYKTIFSFIGNWYLEIENSYFTPKVSGDFQDLVLILPPRCLHIDRVPAHVPQERLANGRFIADLVLNRVCLRRSHDHVGLGLIPCPFLRHRHLGSDFHKLGTSIVLLGDDLRILDLLLKIEDAPLDEGLLILRLFILRVFGKVSVGDRFLQAFRNFRTLHGFELLVLLFQFLESFFRNENFLFLHNNCCIVAIPFRALRGRTWGILIITLPSIIVITLQFVIVLRCVVIMEHGNREGRNGREYGTEGGDLLQRYYSGFRRKTCCTCPERWSLDQVILPLFPKKSRREEKNGDSSGKRVPKRSNALRGRWTLSVTEAEASASRLSRRSASALLRKRSPPRLPSAKTIPVFGSRRMRRVAP